jgi:predicted kinase
MKAEENRIVCFAGLPASGKSYLVDSLERTYLDKVFVLNKDIIRHALFGEHFTEYTSDQDDFVVHQMFDTVRYFFQNRSGMLVIIDGVTFGQSYRVQFAIDYAKQLDVPIGFILCSCDEDIVRERLQKDSNIHLAKNRDFAMYQQCKARFELLEVEHLALDTSDPNKEQERIERVRRYVGL